MEEAGISVSITGKFRQSMVTALCKQKAVNSTIDDIAKGTSKDERDTEDQSEILFFAGKDIKVNAYGDNG